MAHHSATKKSIRQTAKRTALRSQQRSRSRTFLKDVRLAIASSKKDEAQTALRLAESEMMRSVRRGCYKKGTASRTISRLAGKIKALA